MRNIERSHLEAQVKQPVVSTTANQMTTEQAMFTLNSEKSMAPRIAKDLCPYLVVESQGFRSMLQNLEPLYKVK